MGLGQSEGRIDERKQEMKKTGQGDTTTPPELIVRLSRRSDGGVALECRRSDGSVTFQRHSGARARFFPLHDLTHYAVETELGFRRGFCGLIAEGWDIQDTTGKGKRGPLPAEAVTVERIVGSLDLERAGSVEWTAEKMNQQASPYSEASRPVTDEELDRVRRRVRELFSRWAATGPGEVMELSFTRG